MRTPARNKILDFLREDRTISDGPGYLGASNGVLERETGLNGNTIRKVLGQLVAVGAVRATRVGPASATVYRLA